MEIFLFEVGNGVKSQDIFHHTSISRRILSVVSAFKDLGTFDGMELHNGKVNEENTEWRDRQILG